MAITAYVGLPGHGKSHSLVEHVILPAIKAHRTVVTNVALHFDKLRAAFSGADVRPLDLDAVKASPALLAELAPPGCVLVIDEAWQIWPAGQTAKDVPEPYKSLLAQHRHRVDDRGNSMQIVICTQDLGQLGKFARDLVEETYRTLKMGALGASSRYRVDVFRGPVSGTNLPVSKRIRQIPGKYSADVWQWYQSHTQSEAGDAGANEGKIDGRGNVWRSPVWIGGAVLFVLLLGWGVYSVLGFFQRDQSGAAVKVEPRPGVLAPRSGARVPPAGVPISSWRITGEIAGGGVDQVFLQDGNRYVILDARQWCQRDVSGFLICTFEGQRISDQIKYLPEASAPPSVVSAMFPGASPAAE